MEPLVVEGFGRGAEIDGGHGPVAVEQQNGAPGRTRRRQQPGVERQTVEALQRLVFRLLGRNPGGPGQYGNLELVPGAVEQQPGTAGVKEPPPAHGEQQSQPARRSDHGQEQQGPENNQTNAS